MNKNEQNKDKYKLLISINEVEKLLKKMKETKANDAINFTLSLRQNRYNKETDTTKLLMPLNSILHDSIDFNNIKEQAKEEQKEE